MLWLGDVGQAEADMGPPVDLDEAPSTSPAPITSAAPVAHPPVAATVVAPLSLAGRELQDAARAVALSNDILHSHVTLMIAAGVPALERFYVPSPLSLTVGERPQTATAGAGEPPEADVGAATIKRISFANVQDALRHVFSSGRPGAPTRVLLEAPAGSGKTTVIRWIAQNSAAVRNITCTDIVIVVELLRLERFVAEHRINDVTVDVILAATLVSDARRTPAFARVEDAAGIASALRARKDRVLWFFDGYDEVCRSECVAFRKFIADHIHQAVFAVDAASPPPESFAPKMIVASRPDRGVKFTMGWLGPDRWVTSFAGFTRLVIEPWSQRMCDAYVVKFPLTDVQRGRACELLASPMFDGFERLPFAVHLVCCAVHHQGPESTAFLSPSDVFRVVVDCTMRARIADPASFSQVRAALERLAFEAVVRIGASVAIRDDHPQATGLIESGLLIPIGGTSYRFVHKTLLEFLAVEHVLASPLAVDAPPAELNGAPRARIDSFQLRNEVVLYLLGDMLRCRFQQPAVAAVRERVLRRVAERFAFEAEKLFCTLAQKGLLIVDSRASRRAAANEAGVASVLRFFQVSAVRTPNAPHAPFDPDSTRATMRVLFSALRELNYRSLRSRVSGLFGRMQWKPNSSSLSSNERAPDNSVSAPLWPQLMLEPAVALGALYAINELKSHVVFGALFESALIDAHTTRAGRNALNYLREFHCAHATFRFALRTSNVDAVQSMVAEEADKKRHTSEEWRELYLHAAKTSAPIERIIAPYAAQHMDLNFAVRMRLPHAVCSIGLHRSACWYPRHCLTHAVGVGDLDQVIGSLNSGEALDLCKGPDDKQSPGATGELGLLAVYALDHNRAICCELLRHAVQMSAEELRYAGIGHLLHCACALADEGLIAAFEALMPPKSVLREVCRVEARLWGYI